jgi:hypothetical protein
MRRGDKEEGERGEHQPCAAKPDPVLSPREWRDWHWGSHPGPTYIEFR